MRQLPADFWPTSGQSNTMSYLDTTLLRFQGLICRICGFCILFCCGDIVKTLKKRDFQKFTILQKRTYQNLQQLPDHFSPTSGLYSTLGYLGAQLLRFWRLIFRILGFCTLLGSGYIIKTTNYDLYMAIKVWRN